MNCSANYCENGGNCLVMSGSPSPFDAYEEGGDGGGGDRSSYSFEVSPIPLDWRRAEQFCRGRGARLLRVSGEDPASRRRLAAAQEFLTAGRGLRPQGGGAAAPAPARRNYWVDSRAGAVGRRSGKNLCRALSGSDLALRATGCRRSRALYALCQAERQQQGFQQPQLGHSKSDPGLHPLFGRRDEV